MPTVEQNFLGLPPKLSDYARAAYAVLPVPYDGTASYRRGARDGPAAILAASQQVELFDEELQTEPCRAGIATLAPLEPGSASPEVMHEKVFRAARRIVQDGKFLLGLGGEHGISSGLVRAAMARRRKLSVLQIDAHADLRDSYQGSRFSHASVMCRVLELGADVVVVGLRSLSAECSHVLRSRATRVIAITARECLKSADWIERTVAALGPQVYVSVDIDGFDPAYAPGTGTPEPGGLDWHSVCSLLRTVAAERQMIGADVVEVAPIPGQHITEFLAARLVYKIIGYSTGSALADEHQTSREAALFPRTSDCLRPRAMASPCRSIYSDVLSTSRPGRRCDYNHEQQARAGMATTRKFYDSLAEEHACHDRFWQNPYDTEVWRLEHLLLHPHISPSSPILDVGCGFYPHYGFPPSVGVVAGDVSLASLRVARQSPANRKTDLLQFDAHHLPFRSGSFSQAIAGGELLNHVDYPAVLCELARVLTTRGTLLLEFGTKWCLDSLWALFDALIGNRIGYAMTRPQAITFLFGEDADPEVSWDVTSEETLNVRLLQVGNVLRAVAQAGFRTVTVASTNCLSGLIPLPWQQSASIPTLQAIARSLIRLDRLAGRIYPLNLFAGNIFLVCRLTY